MVVELHQVTAAIYLVAGLVSGLSMVLPSARAGKVAVALLVVGVAVHGLAFSRLHTMEPTPPLTELPLAVSFMAWVGTIFFLALMRRDHLGRLVVVIGPLSFLAVFVAAVRLPEIGAATFTGSGSWPHAHVLLASAGLGLLGLAALAGLLFLAEHRRLKAKRPLSPRLDLPSLEALDRVNAVALALGFPLLTLGVVTGAIWVQSESGGLWTGSAHELWSLLAWGVYGVLVAARFGSRQGARRAAASAVAGFAFLFFAVIGVEIFV